MKRVHVLGLAFAAFACALPAAASPPTPLRAKTLVTEGGHIHAFAQDAGAVAWVGHDYAVHVRRLTAKHGSVVGSASSGYTTVVWQLALAKTQALWTSYDAGNFIYTTVHTGSPTLRERAVFSLSFMPGPAWGSWLAGVAGDGSTLVFGTVNQSCDVEWNCRRLDVTGAVERVGAKATAVVGLPSPYLLATSSGRIALVPAKTPRFFPDVGPPRVAEYAPVQIYDSTGQLISTIVADGTPRAISLDWPKLALLFEFVDGRRQIQLYDARTGGYWFNNGAAVFARVPETVKRISVGVPGTVYSVGNAIYLLRRQQAQLIWRAGSAPIGLSLEGRQIAWAENAHNRGQIKVLNLP
jgi:hypothetical protein